MLAILTSTTSKFCKDDSDDADVLINICFVFKTYKFNCSFNCLVMKERFLRTIIKMKAFFNLNGIFNFLRGGYEVLCSLQKTILFYKISVNLIPRSPSLTCSFQR